jgi:RNA polymerase sigma-70 factor (ECF subfamily)
LIDDFASNLAAARTGAEAAWEWLYRRCSPSVLGYLRAQRAPHPEDLLGEVWLQAVRDLPSFRGDEGGFRGWLLRIAHHRLLDARRAASRRPISNGGELPDIADTTDPFDAVDGGDTAQQIADLLDGLPDAQRSVLYLRFVLDLDQKSVADVLGISTPAVKMLQLRATRALARRLDALPSDDDRRLDY